MINKRKILFIFSTIILILFAGSVSYARQEVRGPGFAVIPTKIQLTLPPGARRSVELTAVNDTLKAQRVSFEPWNFARDAAGNPYPISSLDVKTFRGAADWIVLPPPGNLLVKPKKSLDISFALSVPKSASLGTHYAYIRVTGEPAEKKTGQVIVDYEINALLLVTVGSSKGGVPTLKRSVDLKNFSVKRVNYEGPVKFNTDLNNDGNVHLNLQGQILIKKGKALIKKLPIKEYTLLPLSPSVITATWEDPPLFGRFTAEFEGDAGLGRPLKSKTDFWVVSKKLIIALGVGILVFLAASIFFLKKFKIRLTRRSP